MKISTFKTKRCLLREINYNDAKVLVNWRANPEIYRFFKNPVKIDLESHLSWFQNSYLANPNRIDMIASLKGTDNLIGVFGMNRIDGKKIEVSYLLDDNFRGRGYASEVLDALEKKFSKLWMINSFIALIHKDNNASIHFIEKMGYQCIDIQGVFLVFHKSL